MIAWNSDYRQILKEELASRCQVNPQFSLRAFARDIGLTPPQLSAVMKAKYGISPKRGESIARKLGYSKHDTELFRTLIEKEHARSRAQREAAAQKIEKFKSTHSYDTLEKDSFDAISNWHHFAIVELTRVAEFKNDPQWIGRRLNISTIEADLAISRLKRLGLIVESAGTLIAPQAVYGSAPGVPSQARRKFHAQVLKMAAQSIETQKFERRSVSSSVIAVDSTQVNEVRKLSEEFRLKVDALLQNSDRKDAVYCLSVQFFELGQQIA